MQENIKIYSPRANANNVRPDSTAILKPMMELKELSVLPDTTVSLTHRLLKNVQPEPTVSKEDWKRKANVCLACLGTTVLWLALMNSLRWNYAMLDISVKKVLWLVHPHPILLETVSALVLSGITVLWEQLNLSPVLLALTQMPRA